MLRELVSVADAHFVSRVWALRRYTLGFTQDVRLCALCFADCRMKFTILVFVLSFLVYVIYSFVHFYLSFIL